VYQTDLAELGKLASLIITTEAFMYYRVSSALSFIGGVHVSARAMHILNLIWFG
jgi:hypothetical protein